MDVVESTYSKNNCRRGGGEEGEGSWEKSQKRGKMSINDENRARLCARCPYKEKETRFVCADIGVIS